MATRTTARPTVRPEALEAASSFPALEAIFTRRARRFALGAELTGPLAYRSEMKRTAPGPAPKRRAVSSSASITSCRRPNPRYELEFIRMNGRSPSPSRRRRFSSRPPRA